MKPMTNLIGSHQTDVIAAVSEAIRSCLRPARGKHRSHLAHCFLKSLALDSLDLVAVILQIQDRFQVEIDPDEIPNLRCVGDLIASVDNQLKAAA